jgi:hypothetical protein
LTPPNPGLLPFGEPLPQTARDRCRCKDCRKHNRKPSKVTAAVKTFKRVMSQWSLDNLNRGRKPGKGLKNARSHA